jgi:hypothetical protein
MTKKALQNDALIIDMTAANQLPARGEELMRIVTRFEYALKEIGYGRSGRNGEVEVNWDAFANERLQAMFLNKIREANIAPTILANPPSKQIINGGILDWEEKAPPTNIQDFIGAVRRVRNNLIHGGKSGDPDADRNTKLVAEAIEVLLEALRTDVDLRQRFENRW